MSNDNKAASKFDGVLTKLAAAFEKITTLEVYTVVSDFDIVLETKSKEPVQIRLQNKGGAGGSTNAENGLYTAINIFSGDVNNVWNKNFDPVRDKVLLEAHNKNVVLSQEIFAKNLKAVGDLIKEFT